MLSSRSRTMGAMPAANKTFTMDLLVVWACSACSLQPHVVLNGSDTPAAPQGARRESREPVAVTREMRLVGVAGIGGELRQGCRGHPFGQRQEPAEPQHLLQRLGAVAEPLQAVAVQRAGRDAEVGGE